MNNHTYYRYVQLPWLNSYNFVGEVEGMTIVGVTPRRMEREVRDRFVEGAPQL